MPQIELLNVPDVQRRPDSIRTYLQNNFRRVADAIAMCADRVGSKDIEITSSTSGVILRSPNGSRWRLTVSNAGALVITAA